MRVDRCCKTVSNCPHGLHLHMRQCRGKWVRRNSGAKLKPSPAFWPKPAVLYARVYTNHLCACLSQSCMPYSGASRHGFRVIRQYVVFPQNHLILLALWVYYSTHGRSGSCATPCSPQPLATFMHGSERPKHATWRSNLEILFFFITAPRSLSWGRFQGVSVFLVSPGKIKYFCMF